MVAPTESEMGKRIQIIISYDLDLEDGQEPTAEELRAEEQSWANEEVSYQDLVGALANPTIVAKVA